MKDNIFYKRLKSLVKGRGKTFNQIEKELGYSRNALSNYKNCTMPSAIRLLELSDYFEVSPRYLLGKEEPNSIISGNKITVENLFESLSTKQKFELGRICQTWLIHKYEKEESMIN